MGCHTALVTMDKHALGRMSCNPAIGGTAKGTSSKRVDALGVLWENWPIRQEFSSGC